MHTEQNLAIRTMEAKDVETVFEIYRSLAGEERTLINADLIAAGVGGVLDLSLVAWVGNEVVGFILARHTYVGESAAEAGLIQGLGVRPLHQRQGVARRLVNALIESSRSKGIKTLRVMLSERDSKLERFFTTVNFHRARLVIYDMTL